MVVRYIKVTFVTIFVLVVGLISTVNIKGADGLNDLDLVWNTFSDDNGSYNISAIYTNQGGNWSGNWSGEIQNNDNPMIIIIMDDDDNILKEFLLEPNVYTIHHTITDATYKDLSIYKGSVFYENLIHSYSYVYNNGGYLTIQFKYYTSGMIKDYYDVGYDVGNQQSYNVGVQLPNGVSDTIEFRNGQAYYVQRVKKYTLQASDIVLLNNKTLWQRIVVDKPIDLINYDMYDETLGIIHINGFIHALYIDNVTMIGKVTTNAYLQAFTLGFPLDTYDNLAEAQADLVGTEIYYQLAEPIEPLIILGGELQDYYNYGYDDGYDDGIFIVYENGFNGIVNPFNNEFYKNKDSYPYGIGYNDGLLNSEGFTFTGLLTQIFVGIGSILGIELLPNITIGAIVAVPIVFGIIYFILGKRSKD